VLAGSRFVCRKFVERLSIRATRAIIHPHRARDLLDALGEGARDLERLDFEAEDHALQVLVDAPAQPPVLVRGHRDPVWRLDRHDDDEIELRHRVANVIDPVLDVLVERVEIGDEVERAPIEERICGRISEQRDRRPQLRLEILGRRRIGEIVAGVLEDAIRLVEGDIRGHELRDCFEQRRLARSMSARERDPHRALVSQQRGEPADGVGDVLRAGGAVAEQEAGARAAGVAGGERRDPEAVGGRASGEVAIACAARQVEHDVHAGAVAGDAEAGRLERADEDRAALGVEGAHAAKVAREVAVAHEVGEHGLVEGRGAVVEGFANAAEARDEVVRDDDVADAQRGEQDLAEGADVDDALIGVEALERGDRLVVVAVFGVVVVLEDPGAGAARPLEELEAARGGHDRAEGVLVRGRDVRCPDVGCARDAGTDVEAVGVDGDRDDAGAGEGDGIAGPGEAGLLHPGGVAGG
jgi:hypothetical protein